LVLFYGVKKKWNKVRYAYVAHRRRQSLVVTFLQTLRKILATILFRMFIA
jgi:hypothetical protein